MGKGECCVSALAEIRRRADFHCEQGDGSFWLNPEVGEAVPNRRGVGVSNFRSRPATVIAGPKPCDRTHATAVIRVDVLLRRSDCNNARRSP